MNRLYHAKGLTGSLTSFYAGIIGAMGVDSQGVSKKLLEFDDLGEFSGL